MTVCTTPWYGTFKSLERKVKLERLEFGSLISWTITNNTKPTLTGLVQLRPGIYRSIKYIFLFLCHFKGWWFPSPACFNIHIYMKNYISLDILVVLEINMYAFFPLGSNCSERIWKETGVGSYVFPEIWALG